MKSGYELLLESKAQITSSPSERLAILMELCDPSYMDEQGNLVKLEPLISPEMAAKLFDDISKSIQERTVVIMNKPLSQAQFANENYYANYERIFGKKPEHEDLAGPPTCASSEEKDQESHTK